ncbi:MAG TPA: hypothetical protein VG013_41035, partial [Gemmataceae bacterium]|nr:hypothetical protein [Gemmataceae bacterium]
MAQRAIYRGPGGPRVSGTIYYGYEPYQGGNYWAINYGYNTYPDNASGSFDVSPNDQASGSDVHFRFATPRSGGYFHSDVYQPPYGAAAYALLAASQWSGDPSRSTPATGSSPATIRLTLPDPSARV